MPDETSSEKEAFMQGITTNRTVTALFSDLTAAQEVVDDLSSMGFQPETISIVANDASGQYASYLAAEAQASAADEDMRMEEGAGIGALMGGLIGLGAMAIPGIGPVIAAGPLVAALVGAGVGAATGAVTGGLIAGLVELGVPDSEASFFAEAVRRGGTLVLVNTTDDWVERVVDVMEAYHPIDVEDRATEWRAGGWTGFDASAAPMPESQLAADRDAHRDFITGADDEYRRSRVFEHTTG
jgi:hypothetical protein